MFRITTIITVLFSFFALNNVLSATENNIIPVVENEQSLLIENETSAETEIIPNPLVSENDAHGQLYISPYDPGHNLYPVRILAINDWQLSDEDYGKQLLLSGGEHKLKVVPDFSNIKPAKIFMRKQWPEKHIAFSLTNGQHVAVSARLMDKEELEWKVEMYLINPPEERSNISAHNNAINTIND